MTFPDAMSAKIPVFQRLSKSRYVQITDRRCATLPSGSHLDHDAPDHRPHAFRSRRTNIFARQQNRTHEIHMSMRQAALKPLASNEPASLPPSSSPQPTPPTADRSTNDRLLRLPELVRMIGVSRATIYRYIDSGRLPQPVKLSTRCIAWRASEITAWMAALRPA
jgi:prophage regulatory protein